MKKLILLILIFATPAFGAPFLVCDPQPGVESYEIAGDITANVSAEPDGSIKMDMVGIADGTYNIEVKACNIWGCSSASPFGFSKSLCGEPSGIKLSAE